MGIELNSLMKKILVIQQKMIGDVLIGTVICEALKIKYPKADIHYLVNESTLAVVFKNPFISTIVALSKEEQSSKKGFWRFLKKIRAERYDVVIDAYGKLESNMITFLSGAPEKVSFDKWYSRFFYTKTIQKASKSVFNSSLAIENRLRLVSSENLIRHQNIKPKIYLSKDESVKAKTFLLKNGINLNQKIFMISVVGSDSKKTYPFNYMAILLDFIIMKEPNAQILFNYIPTQIEKAQNIYNLTNENTKKKIFFHVFGHSLRDFLGITSFCSALIGNEGGATNMAKAMEIPTFVIFSPYINITNWHGTTENLRHVAVHLSEYIPYQKNENKKAKKFYNDYYQKFKPAYIQPALAKFLNTIQ